VNPENCWKDSTIFTNTSVGNGTIITGWSWMFGDASPPGNSVAPKHLYSLPGSYQIKLVVVSDKGCVSDTIIKPVIVNNLPVAGFKTSIDCSNRKVTFTDTSTVNSGVIQTWHWNLGDGLDTVIHNNTSFIHGYPLSGVPYTVTLTDTTNKGCYNRSPFQQIINILLGPGCPYQR
jgi:PKD repeat protein